MTRSLAAVRITGYWHNPRTGQQEACEAITDDGKWLIVREDDKRTNWATCVADGSCPVPVMYSGTLEDAQGSIASGYAGEALERAKAALAGVAP